jgi:hypothetical protein
LRCQLFITEAAKQRQTDEIRKRAEQQLTDIAKCKAIEIHRITGFSDFVHRPDSKQLEEKHDISETGSLSVLR